MTNFDMIKAVLRCDDIHAQKVYRAMVLGGYEFDRHLMEDFAKAAREVSLPIKKSDETKL